MTGSDANGEQIAELHGTLPEKDLALVVQLLTSGAAALGKAPRSATRWRSAASNTATPASRGPTKTTSG
ncbi:hypothetical protein [Nonomuraea recticatena]|uniref:hypothetical protein n=1 Tax=Nonomuraea recticatena TaxID=46178 RepID=UPI0031F762C5